MSTALVDLAGRSSMSADSGGVVRVRTPRIVSAIDGVTLSDGFGRGWGGDRSAVLAAREVVAGVRALWGFQRRPSALLTAPENQHKLELGAVPSFGLTLHHHRFTSRIGRAENLCPWAGACTSVCVVENGNGRYDSVQRAWGWRTDLLLHHPEAFGVLWGHELRRATIVDLAGPTSTSADSGGPVVWCRPNVNSDIPWHDVARPIVDGTITGTSVLYYDYSKRPTALLGNGWATRVYRVAASVHERTDTAEIDACLARGGSVAVVTDRRRSEPVRQWHPTALVQNADLSDGWLFTGGTIGDLSFKPRDRQTAATAYRRGFVRSVYRGS